MKPSRSFQNTAALATDHAAYKYTATFKPKDKPRGESFGAIAFVADASAQAALDQAAAIAAGVRQARVLGNLPPNICNPGYLAEQARKLAGDHANVVCEVLERPEMLWFHT